MTDAGDPAPLPPVEGRMIGWHDEAGDTHRGTLFAAFAALAGGQAWSFPRCARTSASRGTPSRYRSPPSR
ncbi:hypothetical protein [Sphingomonas hankookensis]|uniref:hypothetical protein n=1 Tax=Sphingomonas hankookensis TaxID=563996 RepID=UPI003F7A1A0A